MIVSTLETKLQRIENLDKAVEHLMRRLEALDSRVNDNIDKTDAVIAKLKSLDLKLFQTQQPAFGNLSPEQLASSAPSAVDSESDNATSRRGASFH